jgi:putative inorganic carbon (HCO3(-)) transporter
MTAERSETRPAWAAVAFCCLVGGLLATLLVAVPREWLVTDRFTFPKAMLFHAAALATAVACLAGARRWRLDAVALLAGVFAGLGLLSALLVAHNPWLTLGAVGVTLSGGALFLSARALAEGDRREAMLRAVVVAAGLLAVSVLLEAHGPLAGLSTMNRAPGGLLGHRNRAAHLLVLSLPVAWLCVRRARERWGLGLLLAAVMALGAAITLTRSRAAWLAVFVLGVAAAGAWWRGRRDAGDTSWRTAGFLVALLAGVGAALGLPNALEWRSPYADTLRRIGEHDAGSGRGRLIQYANTLRMVGDAPVLGVGPGNWMVHYPRYATPGDPSYSVDALLPVDALPQADWLGLLAERGAPALGVLAAIAGLLLREAWRRARQDPERKSREEALALMAVLIALLVLGGLDTVLLTPAATFLVAVIVGALTRTQREWRVVLPGRGTRWAALAGGVLLVGGVLGYGAVTGWARQLAHTRPQTEARLARAVSLDPGGYEARVFLGQWLFRSGRCEQALEFFQEASHLLPHAELPRRASSRCQRLLQARQAGGD